MDARRAQRLEEIADWTAAAAIAAAVGFAMAPATGSIAAILAAAGAALVLALIALRQLADDGPGFELAPFPLADLPPAEFDELLLSEADRLDAAQPPATADELVLDDVLSQLGEGSRVVRLFDASAMPTPGQLRARIDTHLGQAVPPSLDASAALHEALAELRRSLN